VKLTIHLNLVPRLRTSEAIPPFPNTSSWRGTSVSTGTTLPLCTTYESCIFSQTKQSAASRLTPSFDTYLSRRLFSTSPLYTLDKAVRLREGVHTLHSFKIKVFLARFMVVVDTGCGNSYLGVKYISYSEKAYL
jgi:hypothetical protein